MHSATKYIGGHSDVLGGALAVRDKSLYDRLYFIQNATGAVMAPLGSYLCSRGSKTLELRVREQSRTAAAAGRLAGQRPASGTSPLSGPPAHPGHAVAAADGRCFWRDAQLRSRRRFCNGQALGRLHELFQLAVSLGAVESLIEQPA